MCGHAVYSLRARSELNLNLPNDPCRRLATGYQHSFGNNSCIELRYLDVLIWYGMHVCMTRAASIAHFNKGICLNSLGRHGDALGSYDKVLRIKPQDVDTWNNKGISLYQLGRNEEAVECYDKALQINPKYASQQRHVSSETWAVQ